MLALSERRGFVLIVGTVREIAMLCDVDDELERLTGGRPHGQHQDQRDES